MTIAPMSDGKLDFQGLAAFYLPQARELLWAWFPNGRVKGREFEVGDLAGSPGHSLKFNLDTGAWADFATGEKGGDLISLYAATRRIAQGEAFKVLAQGTPFALGNGHPPLTSKPEEAKPLKPRGGTPPPAAPGSSETWCYRDADGEPLFYVTRHEKADGGKYFLPWTWSERGWVQKGWPAPRPLYGLDLLTARLNDSVLIVEGEKTADAARRMAGDPYVVVTWPSGAKAMDKADFSPLYGRRILLSPDADKPGIEAMDWVAAHLREHCPGIKIIDVTDMPEGWDLADAPETWGWQEFRVWAESRTRLYQPPAASASNQIQPGERKPSVVDVARSNLARKGKQKSQSAEVGEGLPEAEVVNVSDEKAQHRETQASRLVHLVLSRGVELFHDAVGKPYARIAIEGHREIWSLHSTTFRQWLARLSWEAERKAYGGEVLTSAIGVLAGIACFDGAQHELHNRVAWHDGAIWYDLSDLKWRAVRITASEWKVVADPPILFARHAHQQPQVEPARDGDAWLLRRFVNVREQDLLLLLCWEIAALVPGFPHPIPNFHGPKGAAKTSAAMALRRLVDPSAMEVLSFPSNVRELVQILSHHYFAPFDNISSLSDEISDVLCRAVTGEGVSKRALYSDDDDIIYRFKRCAAFTGINVAAQKPDLLDRSLLIGLERIAPGERLEQVALWADFEEACPHVMGGMFTTLSRAMAIFPSIQLNNMPRMADFARWGEAISQALGQEPGEFIEAYNKNLQAQNEEVLGSHPVAAALVKFMEGRPEWHGVASDLLPELTPIAEKLRIDIKARTWPKAANALTRRLNEVVANLAEAGIKISRGRERAIILTLDTSQNTVQTVTIANPLPGNALKHNGSQDDPLRTAEAAAQEHERSTPCEPRDSDGRDDRDDADGIPGSPDQEAG